jgi:hydroxymethylglutaryl-CoA reductase (NADPH)
MQPRATTIITSSSPLLLHLFHYHQSPIIKINNGKTFSTLSSLVTNTNTTTTTTPPIIMTNNKTTTTNHRDVKLTSEHQLNNNNNPMVNVDDDFLLTSLESGKISQHQLERVTGSNTEGVRVRRLYVEEKTKTKLTHLPRRGEDFNDVHFYNAISGQNCESVIGFLPLPVGVVGPLKVDGSEVFVPMATTEGALIASTNRGARALGLSMNGVETAILRDAMSRSPVLSFRSALEAADFAKWIEDDERKALLSKWFSETTKFGTFSSVKASIAGRNVFLRFRCRTGDAMGMNMVGKGVNLIIERLLGVIPGMELIALSGNTCTDKKPSAINWVEGRGKSVVAEAFIPSNVVKDILKTSIDDIVRVGLKKNLIGSALAGSIGGNNAHAANVVTAIFLATGQDPAQNVESSNTMTLFESIDNGSMLHASVTMPSLEVGTVGGGTTLAAQAASLDMLGVRGASKTDPGKNARRLASIIAASVLAGELSLNAALASNHLISAHMALNRRPTSSTGTTSLSSSTGTEHHHHHVPSFHQEKRTSHRVPLPEPQKHGVGSVRSYQLQHRSTTSRLPTTSSLRSKSSLMYQGDDEDQQYHQHGHGQGNNSKVGDGAFGTPRLTVP